MRPPCFTPALLVVVVLLSAPVSPEEEEQQSGSPPAGNEENSPDREGPGRKRTRLENSHHLAHVSLEDSPTDPNNADLSGQNRSSSEGPLVTALGGLGHEGGYLDVESEDPLVSDSNGSSASWRNKFDDHWSKEKKLAWLQHRLLQEETKCLQLQYRDLASARNVPNRTELYDESFGTTPDDNDDDEVRLKCPRVWDSIMCWGPAEPNTTLEQPCPDYVPGLKAGYTATRTCMADGTWFEVEANALRLGEATVEGVNGTEEGGVGGGGQGRARGSTRGSGWTNYSLCLPRTAETPPLTDSQQPLIEEWLPVIKQMSLVGYSVSLGTLAISFVILASLRKLRCPRNLLHLHLFASFMLRAIVVLVKSLFLFEATAFVHNFNLEDGARIFNDSGQTWSCKLMICVWQYFILANYSWILMEGLYLHNLIFMALFTDSSAITMYIVLGWGLPLMCVVSWATLRSLFDNEHCWTVNNSQWIFIVCIKAPVGVSNVANFFFFLNVTRVLLLKLRSSVSAESVKYRKLGRSTLVLVPLFGVHYFLLLWLSTSTNTHVELLWLFLDQVFASFQGFFVAVLYCLMNGEVRQELRKLYSKWNLRYNGDALVFNSHSTLISHTKTYTSRGRMSLPSIHSTAADRRDRQTPSPQTGPSEAAHSSLHPSRNIANNSPNLNQTIAASPNATLHASSTSPRPPLTPFPSLNPPPPASTSVEKTAETKDTNFDVQSIELCETPCSADPKTKTPTATTTKSTKTGSTDILDPPVRDIDPKTDKVLTDSGQNCRSTKISHGKVTSPPSPSTLQNGHVVSRSPKVKGLHFPDSAEKPLQVKGETEDDSTVVLSEDQDGLGMVVDVNPKSLTSTKGPVEVKAHVLQGGSGGGGGGEKEHETML